MDLALLALLLLSFATLLTVHVVICVRLLFAKDRRWRGIVALLVPPLAPWWSREEAWRTSTRLWLGAVVVYALARVGASF
jgi:hypothetical protein